MNDPTKVVKIKKFLAKNNICLVPLIETKIKEKNSSKILKKLGDC